MSELTRYGTVHNDEIPRKDGQFYLCYHVDAQVSALEARVKELEERAEQAKELTRSVKRTYDLNLRTLEENYEIQMREDTQEILDANDRIITLTVERDTWRSLAERAEAQVAAYEKPVSLD